jgi:hypothetical protein
LPALDERAERACEAASVWVEKRRSITPTPELWADADVVFGTTIYASLLYQSRAQPQGFPGMDDLGTYSEDVGQAMSNVYRLVGSDPVIA